jgi:thiamine-phosphate pyrophosphorylase
MPPELTAAVRRAMEFARTLACHDGSSEVQPRHLLAGLLADEDGRASCRLASLGADPATVRTALGLIPVNPPTSADSASDGTDLPEEESPAGPANSHPIVLAIHLARHRSAQLGVDGAVTSDSLLIALLLVDPPLASWLVSLGLDPVRIESERAASDPSPLPIEESLDLAEPAEQIDAARIIDANANRAREALRVVEDCCRFALDDAFLTGQLKQLRHDLAEALAGIPPQLLLGARETQHDVGTRQTTSREHVRHSLPEVVLANLKRLQEALRTLEEVSKLSSAGISRQLEQIRYRSYTLERAVVLGTDARHRLADVRICVLLSGGSCKAALDWTIGEAAAGGARIFQLREKNLTDRELIERARNVRRWTREVGALFIVNDRPDIARLVEADGVHLGQDDLPVKEARRIAGPRMLIGVSTHSIEQLRQAILDGASYVGVGPTFPSATKQFAGLAGLDYVRQAMAETSLPAFAIGGVNLETVPAVAAAGAKRVAVSHAVCQADDPRRVVKNLLEVLTG